ncbi:hypothetical protein RhiirA5_438809 [Rhizophagus irregularis]|uniref:Uncharacterized protein n=1 Tax=Rhizophagus irregularis TaxID=588596 RepID=A0A2N0NIM6_9GLOM|nr:hypothetical protein RhiirA5_438809 [Rhizophagus irregularis]
MTTSNLLVKAMKQCNSDSKVASAILPSKNYRSNIITHDEPEFSLMFDSSSIPFCTPLDGEWSKSECSINREFEVIKLLNIN